MTTSRQNEIEVIGIPASPGIAIAPAYLLTKNSVKLEARRLKDTEVGVEIERFRRAIAETQQGIERTRRSAVKQTGDIVARIFDSHLLILDDVVMQDDICKRISDEKICAEYLVNDFMQRIYKSLKAQKGEYFSQRADDVLDVARRLISHLQGLQEDIRLELKHQVVLVAHDLMPSDIIHLQHRYVVGIATDLGAATSHTAILTRSLGVPAVTGLKNISTLVCAGQQIVVNGNSGKVVLFPTPAHIRSYEEKRKRFLSYAIQLRRLRDLPTQTTDGHRIQLMANIELPAESEAVSNAGAEGVGLFRTEYLFLARGSLPSEVEQIKEYRRVAEAMKPHPVVIRTYDLGGDKIMPGLELPREDNPFLGWRAIRVGLDMPDLLKTQYSAILQAAVGYDVRILLPLVSELDEIRQAKAMLVEVQNDLEKQGIPYNRKIPLGIMIEVPSAVIMAEQLAAECDFFSIGTNDLVQYTLAVDRGNESVAHLYTGFHPAVIRLLKQTVLAAQKAGIATAICGEMGGNPLATLLLIGLGIEELSVSPVVLPEIKKIIRSVDIQTAQEVATKCFTFQTSQEIEKYLLKTMKRLFADLPVWFNKD